MGDVEPDAAEAVDFGDEPFVPGSPHSSDAGDDTDPDVLDTAASGDPAGSDATNGAGAGTSDSGTATNASDSAPSNEGKKNDTPSAGVSDGTDAASGAAQSGAPSGRNASGEQAADTAGGATGAGGGKATNKSSGTSGDIALRIFVGGLNFETPKERLKAYFEQWGPVEDAVILHERGTRKSRGFGFVRFSSKEGAW